MGAPKVDFIRHGGNRPLGGKSSYPPTAPLLNIKY